MTIGEFVNIFNQLQTPFPVIKAIEIDNLLVFTNTREFKYPLLFIEYIDTDKSDFHDEITFRLSVCDYVLQDKSNLSQVIDDTHIILNDVIQYLNTYFKTYFNIVNQPSILPFYDKYADQVSGNNAILTFWSTDVNCGNIAQIDVPPISCFDCGDVAECDVIVQIQEDLTLIEGDITVIEGNITTINGQISDIQSDIITIDGEIQEIQDVLVVYGNNITTLQTDKEDKSNKKTSISSPPSNTNYLSEKATVDYINAQIAALLIYTSSNGITKTSNNFKLGGSIIEDTTLSGAFTMNLDLSNFNLKSSGTTILSSDNTYLYVGNTSLSNMKFRKNTSEVNFTSTDGTGIVYVADYSGTYTTRSLVDKGYVDAAIAANSPAASKVFAYYNFI